MVAGFETIEAATAFRDNSDLASAMGDAGFVGRRRFESFEEVESVTS